MQTARAAGGTLKPTRPKDFTEVTRPGRLSLDAFSRLPSSCITSSVDVFYSLKEALEYGGKFYFSRANITYVDGGGARAVRSPDAT